MRKTLKSALSMVLSVAIVLGMGSVGSLVRDTSAKAADGGTYTADLWGQMDTTKATVGEWVFSEQVYFKLGEEVTLTYNAGDKIACWSGYFISIDTDLTYTSDMKVKVSSIKYDGVECDKADLSKVTVGTDLGQTTLRITLSNIWANIESIYSEYQTFKKMEITFAVGNDAKPLPGFSTEPGVIPGGVATPTPTVPPTSTPTASPTPTSTPTPELGISASQTELNADAQGVFASNKVEMAVTSSYSCTVSSSDSWLRVCKKNASASADSIIWIYGDESEWTGSFYVFADENTSVIPRTGEITITAEYGEKKVTETVVVKQEAAKASLSVSAKKITANAKGKTSVASVEVDTNKTGGFSVSNNGNSWIKVGSSSYGDGAKSNISFESEGTFYIYISENPSEEERAGQITVTHEDGETREVIEVVQEGTKAVLSVDSTSKTADDSGYF